MMKIGFCVYNAGFKQAKKQGKIISKRMSEKWKTIRNKK